MTIETTVMKPARSPLSLWAIIVGGFVDIGLTLVGGVFLLPFTTDLIAQLIFGLAMTAVGGYVAASVAGRRNLAHGLGVGILSTIVGLVLTRLGAEALTDYPLWHRILAVSLTIPAAVVGAWVRKPPAAGGLPIPRPPAVYPSLGQAIWLALLAIFASGVMIMVVGVPAFVVSLRERGTMAWWIVPAIFAGFAAGYALILVWAARRSQAPAKEVFPITRVSLASVWPVLLTCVGLAILFGEVVNLIQKLFPPPPVPVDLVKIFDVSAEARWTAVGFIVVVGPLAEELLFRGVILRGFLSRYSARGAIVASALVFGAYHLNPFQFVTATILGLLFGWWRVQTGSLVLPFLGHALNNGLALGMPRLPWVSAATAGVAGTLPSQPVWFDLLGVALLVVGLFQFVRVIRARRPEPVPAVISP